MPRDSRRVRQLRRLKRERTNALRMLDHVLIERNVYRQILTDAQQKYRESLEQLTEAKEKEEILDTRSGENETQPPV